MTCAESSLCCRICPAWVITRFRQAPGAATLQPARTRDRPVTRGSKDFQCPVRRSRRIVVFTHRQFDRAKPNVRMPSRSKSAAVATSADGAGSPFDNPVREHIQFSKGHRTPEGDHGKAVGQAATKRRRCPVGGRHKDKIRGKQPGTFTQRSGATGVLRAEGGIQQAIK